MKTDSTGQIQKREERPAEKLITLINRSIPEIARAVPRHMTPDRLARLASTAIRVNPRLGECTPVSVVGSFFQAAALGLEPNTPLGHAFLVPFRNSKKDIVECQLIIGYKGYIDLGYRSKMVKSLEARVVHELDYFEYEEGTEDFIRHKRSEDSKREQSPITHAYAIVKTTTGGRVFQVLTREQIDKRRKRSANARTDYSAWVTDYGPMACKSAIRALHPYIPQSSELAIADSLDRSLDIGETQVLSPEITEVLERQGLVVEEQLNEPPDDIETVTDKE